MSSNWNKSTELVQVTHRHLHALGGDLPHSLLAQAVGGGLLEVAARIQDAQESGADPVAAAAGGGAGRGWGLRGGARWEMYMFSWWARQPLGLSVRPLAGQQGVACACTGTVPTHAALPHPHAHAHL